MTQEETIAILRGMTKNNEDEDAAIFAAIRALSMPQLPFNLDEAAIDAAQLDMQDRQIMEATNDERLRYSRIFRRGFKAGAEWMAGQGETHELTVESPVLGPPMICCPVHADNGDKVVVQIRKK